MACTPFACSIGVKCLFAAEFNCIYKDIILKIEFFNLFTVHTLFNNSCIKLVLIYFQVIACLKQQYRKNKRLSRLCENEIVRIMREAAQDYNLDPQLTQACSGEVCISFII